MPRIKPAALLSLYAAATNHYPQNFEKEIWMKKRILIKEYLEQNVHTAVNGFRRVCPIVSIVIRKIPITLNPSIKFTNAVKDSMIN